MKYILKVLFKETSDFNIATDYNVLQTETNSRDVLKHYRNYSKYAYLSGVIIFDKKGCRVCGASEVNGKIKRLVFHDDK